MGGGTANTRTRRAVAIADNLTDTAESLLLNWLHGIGTPTRPTTPLKVALVTANGSDSAAGTEVTGGTYARQNITLTSSTGGSGVSNDTDIVFTGMPACTVVGIEIWDSAGSPVRLWHGPLTANKTLNAGDELKLAAGDVDLAIQ
ncbi:hypothetical protein PV377_03165 [Streptomyces ipomoeae]|uniref:phage tail fiber protein n=1 Tax=Streptomyces ipomoeae TaxID=103232 RepID=UPI0029A1E938|nr:hypothetical protein [Streptomyces ipomoeae]MDX2838013.1 hypothetical protein [Streptomyces ipomoeae]